MRHIQFSRLWRGNILRMSWISSSLFLWAPADLFCPHKQQKISSKIILNSTGQRAKSSFRIFYVCPCCNLLGSHSRQVRWLEGPQVTRHSATWAPGFNTSQTLLQTINDGAGEARGGEGRVFWGNPPVTEVNTDWMVQQCRSQTLVVSINARLLCQTSPS